MCNHSAVALKDSTIFWSAIVVQQVMNYTLSSWHFKKCEIIQKFLFISIYFKRCKSLLQATPLSCT